MSCMLDPHRGTDLVLEHHSCIHVTHTQYRFLQSNDKNQHPRKDFCKHGTYQYVRLRTRYILLCTSWTKCTFSREWESILMLGYHHLLVPHTQHHFPRSKVKEMSLHIVSGKLGLDRYIPVHSSDLQVHTHTDHTHTTFQIRHHHHCDSH